MARLSGFLKRGVFRGIMRGAAALAGATLLAGSPHPSTLEPATLAPAQAPASTLANASGVLDKYCTTCHNPRLKTAGIVIEPAGLARVGAEPEVWEKVVRKLRSESMPPAGSPRPEPAAYESTSEFIERALDREAERTPNPGAVPMLHRLSRTEYRNAIRDLLALDDLPIEMDYTLLLPSDNVSSGFDNIADLLFISPTTMERYLDAARKISRLAVGDISMLPMVNIHKLDPEQWQDERVEELPFGTRGGLAIRSYFPLDAEYSFKIDTAGSARDPQQIEIMVDGERRQLTTLGAAAGGRGGGRGGTGGGLEFRIPIPAGPHEIGVTFVERNEAFDEATLRPRMRARGTLTAVAGVTIAGPYNASGPGNSPSRRNIFLCRPDSGASEAQEVSCARRILAALARRAYRQPASAADIDLLLPFYTAGRKEGGFDLGIQKALERLLVSPQFLFRIERDPTNPTPAAPGTLYRISDLELASRLSFFIWSSIPDDALLDAAEAGTLHQPEVLDRHVRRMLSDPRAVSLVTNFAEQWLYLRDLDKKQLDEILFPDFDETLRRGLRRETELFLESVLLENRSVLDLLTANYTFVNERVAKHYRIPNVQGSYFRRVDFPEGSPRGGLLGQGSILTLTSYSIRTSPVVRGKWVLENLLGAPPPPPPPDVPALKTEGAAPGTTLSMREAMTQHRANPACASCHARMDPIGFAMENFDAVGRWRETEYGRQIDASGARPDGTPFNGMAGLKRMLTAHPEQFVSALSEKLLMYALGRNLQYYDAPAVRKISQAAGPLDNTFASLVLGVVQSVPFQMREAR